MTQPVRRPLFRRRESISPSPPSDISSNQRDSPTMPDRLQQQNFRRFSRRSSTGRSGQSTQSPQASISNMPSEMDQIRFVTPASSIKSSPPATPPNIFLLEKQHVSNELHQMSAEEKKIDILGPNPGIAKSSIDASRAQAVVVGAGLAGLTVAHYLKKEGMDPIVFEKSSRVGGRVLAIPNDKSARIFENTKPKTSLERLSTPAQDPADRQAIIKDSSLEAQNHKIDVGFQSIPHDSKDLLDLIKSFGLQVSSVGDGTVFIQPPGKISSKLWKSSMVKDTMLRPSGGMSALVDALQKDVNVKTNHELIHITWSSNYWRLLFQHSGSKSGFSIATRLLFIAIPPKQFAKVGNDNLCIPRSLTSVMEYFPTKYTNTITFAAHYNSQFWGSRSPVAFSPRGPIVEAFTLSDSETGSFAIVGRLHSQAVKTVIQDPVNSPNSRPDLKIQIIRHLCDLFGIEAQSARSVTLVDWREMDNEENEKIDFQDDNTSIADRLRRETSSCPDYGSLYEQFCECSETLALRGLFFVVPDCQVSGIGVSGDVAQQAKKAVFNATRFKNFM